MHFDLNAYDRPEYVALSYTWELMYPLRPISINGEKFEVSDNLWQFLKSLRNERCFDTYFWIDQKDNYDKNYQVNGMPGIYNDAKKTIIWLGPDDGGEHSAAKLVGRMATGTPAYGMKRTQIRGPALPKSFNTATGREYGSYRRSCTPVNFTSTVRIKRPLGRL